MSRQLSTIVQGQTTLCHYIYKRKQSTARKTEDIKWKTWQKGRKPWVTKFPCQHAKREKAEEKKEMLHACFSKSCPSMCVGVKSSVTQHKKQRKFVVQQVIYLWVDSFFSKKSSNIQNKKTKKSQQFIIIIKIWIYASGKKRKRKRNLHKKGALKYACAHLPLWYTINKIINNKKKSLTIEAIHWK